MKFTWDQIEALDPCEAGLDEAKAAMPRIRSLTVAKAVKFGIDVDNVIWALSALARLDKGVERKLRLWMADCAAHVLHIYEKTGTSDAPRNAIIAARQFANGEIDDAARDAAWAAAGDAARAAAWAAAWDAAGAAAWDAAGAAAWDAARGAAGAAAGDAARGAARAAAGDAEIKWQNERLALWFSEKEPEPFPLPDLKKEAA